MANQESLTTALNPNLKNSKKAAQHTQECGLTQIILILPFHAVNTPAELHAKYRDTCRREPR